jgi:hypothetical protein
MNKELLKKNIRKPRKQRATKSKIKSKPKNKQNQINQKVVINLGNALKQTRKKSTTRRDKSLAGYRPNSVPTVDIVKYDISPLQAQLIQQAETIRMIRERNDEKPNEMSLILHMKEQQKQYENDKNDIINSMKSHEKQYKKALLKNDDIGSLYHKLTDYHNHKLTDYHKPKIIEIPKEMHSYSPKIIELSSTEQLINKRGRGRPKNPNTVPKKPSTMTRADALMIARQKRMEKLSKQKEAQEIKKAFNAQQQQSAPNITQPTQMEEETVNQYYDALNE